jgi:hypothetical protein
MGVIRIQLAEMDTRRPAAHALLEIQLPGPTTVYGLADEQGNVAVIFPYPTFTRPPRLPSPPLPANSAGAQRWPITVRVRSSPATLLFPTGAPLPDLRSIVNQAPAAIWSTLVPGTGPPVDQLSSELTFGQELVISTEGESTLLISTTASPL